MNRVSPLRRGRRPIRERGAGLYVVRLWLDHVILDGRGASLDEAIVNLRRGFAEHGLDDAPTVTDTANDDTPTDDFGNAA